MKTTTIFILTLLICQYAQADFRIYSRHITTADGLTGNTINELTQDEQGYIWMATNTGLSRYDGYSTLNYPSLSPDKEHRLEARIGRIFHDATHHLLWLSTATYQNACYDLRRSRFIDYSGRGDIYRQQNKLMLTSQGMVLYGLNTGATLCGTTDGSHWTKDYTEQQKSLPSNNVLSVMEDSAHNVWLNTDRGFAVIRADRQDRQTVILVGGQAAYGVVAAAASASATYVLTQDGTVYAYDNHAKQIFSAHLPPLTKVNASFTWQGKWMLFTPDGTIAIDLKTGMKVDSAKWQVENGLSQGALPGYHFIGTRAGELWIFPDHGEAVRLELIPNARFVTNKGWLFHVAADRKGRLFIATYGNGLFVYSPDSIQHYRADDAKPIIDSDYLLCAITDHQGHIWIGSETAGAYCLSQQDEEAVRYLLPQPSQRGGWGNSIRSILSREDGTIQLGTRDGSLYETDGTAALRLTGHHTDSATCRITDRQGRLWTGTFGHGIFTEGRQYMADDINGSRINDFKLATDGTLWVASNNGLYRWNGSDFDVFNPQNGRFSHSEVHTICFSDPQTLWAGTAGGGVILCSLTDDGSIAGTKAITMREGLANNNVTTLVCDGQGFLWAGTEDGLSRIGLDSRNVAGTYRFSESLQGNNVSNNCGLLTDDGHLLFGTAEGLLMIALPFPHPDTTAPPSPRTPAPPRLRTHLLTITSMAVNGETLMADWPTELRHDENSLSFHYSCFDYGQQQRAMYQHYLEGVESHWQPVTTDSHADYAQLQPGRYTFHVRVLNAQGTWDKETTLTFTILQPWYNRWWAWTLYLLIAALIAWHFYRNWRERFQLHQQMKMERQLSEFRQNLFTNITHEFRTPLAIIRGAVDKLSQDSGNRAALQTVQRGSSRLLRLVNQFMEFRKISTGNLRLQVEQGDIIAFVRDIVQDFWAMAQQKEIQMTFLPPVKSLTMTFDRQKVETIVYNLISNALKYTPERGAVVIRIKTADDANGNITITVDDNGPGISTEQQAELFKPFMHGYVSQGGMGIGLYTARQMAVSHKGTLNYEALQPGSRFTLTLPATDTAYEAADYRDTTAASQQSTASQPSADDVIIREMQPEAFNDLTVAVIEDNPDMMQQIRQEVGVYFRTVGYTTGETGIEGVTADCPALLICDVMLPDTDGYRIISRLKADARTANLPVIMLTALDDEQHQIRAYRAGADDYMVKPCNFRLLIARAIQLIKWRMAQQPHESPETPKSPETLKSHESPESQGPQAPVLIESHQDKLFKEKLALLTAQHLSEETFSVDRLAELMKMGRTKFYGKVKELTGMSPNKYLQEARMERAAKLLLEGELTVSEISYKVGLQDPSYFNKVFKARYGVVPSKYGRSS